MNIFFMVLGGLMTLEALSAQLLHNQLLYAWGAASGPSWYGILMGAFVFLFGLVGFLHRKKRSG